MTEDTTQDALPLAKHYFPPLPKRIKDKLTPTTKVISYKRFSSKKQGAGDSFRRQVKIALDWCEANGLELYSEQVFEDLGVSGFTGKNSAKGAMGVLRDLAESGKLPPGTIILIEAFDRLTRMPITRAQELLLSLVNNGMIVVTLTDGKCYDEIEMRRMDTFMMSLFSLYQGFEESNKKSRRLMQIFRHAAKIGDKTKFGTYPGWLYRTGKGSDFFVNEQLADSVRKVYAEAAKGFKCKQIALTANREKWPNCGRLNATDDVWTVYQVRKLLNNRAVLGEHEHKRYSANDESGEAPIKNSNGDPSGIIHHDYYPRIISDELWLSSRAAFEPAGVRVVRKDVEYLNVWSGLVYCGHCGAPVQRRHWNHGKSIGQLLCRERAEGATDCPTMAVEKFDLPVLMLIYRLASAALVDMSSDSVSDDIAQLEEQLAEAETQLRRCTELLIRTDSGIDALIEQAKELDKRTKTIKAQILTAKEALVVDSNALFADQDDVAFIDFIRQHLHDRESEASKEIRANLSVKIKRIVERIYVWPYQLAKVQFKLPMLGTDTAALFRVELPAKSASRPHQPLLALDNQGELSLPAIKSTKHANTRNLRIV